MSDEVSQQKSVSLAVDQALQQAIAHHQAGQLQEAEQIYRAILQAQPNHPDANHNLGVLAVQVEQPVTGLPHFKAALEANPNVEQYWLSYMDALIQADQRDAAKEVLRRGREIGLQGPAVTALAAKLEELSGGEPSEQEISMLVAMFAEGRYAEAASLAQQLTELFSLHGFGWKGLGVVLKKLGRPNEALIPMQKAAALMSRDAEAHSNLGVVLQELGQLDEAAASHRQAAKINPDFAEAHYNLGVVLREVGQLDDAVNCYRRALEIKPDYVEAHCNLGVVLQELGQLDEAVTSCRTALEIKPDYAEAFINLGIVLRNLGQLDAAVTSYRQALEIKPDYAEAHSNLGNALKDLGRLDEAVTSCRTALEINPDFAEAYYNLGVVLREVGQLDAAVNCYRRALEIKPDYAEAHCNLGVVLQELGQLDEAVTSCRTALEIKPDYAEALINLGVVLRNLGQLDAAVASYRQALEIKPDYAEAHSNLGNALKDLGRLDEAIACFRGAVALDPRDIRFLSNLVYSVCFHPTFDEQSILREVKQFGSVHTLPLHPSASLPVGHDYTTVRRLRIGYVSPDFRNHCQSLFTIPLLSNHDHSKFQIHCYAKVNQPDEITRRLAAYADVWRSTNGQNDEQLATMIESDGIDVLIDLTMHMADGRPALFAHKPAPVQVAWLAYPGTTGIPTMDYRLTDPWLDPPEFGDHRYTETSIRLPHTFWCYAPLISGIQPNALPALTKGHVTFGCLNNFVKVSDDTLHRWARVMLAVPSSRLIVMAPPGSARKKVLWLLGKAGVDAERIEFVGRQPQLQYLQTYHRIDLCLDTLPYNGHTTSIDSYWMGVPVVTQVGDTVVGRAGWSQLNNLGLPELAAFDEQSFIDIAVSLAKDIPRLDQLRQTLRNNLESSSLMDGKRFAAAIENVYLEIWERACLLARRQK